MKHALRLLAIGFVVLVTFLSSLNLVMTVSDNSSAVENARDAVLASCQNLNRKIDSSTSPEAQASTNFLIAEILEHATPAEQAKYKRLAAAAAETPLRKTRCDQIVQRTFPE